MLMLMLKLIVAYRVVHIELLSYSVAVACGVVSLVAEAVAVRVLSQPAAAVAHISVFDVSCGTPP